jgi:hypothetical protein
MLERRCALTKNRCSILRKRGWEKRLFEDEDDDEDEYDWELTLLPS